MITANYVVQMASYNEWMNAKLYEAAGKLSAQELAAGRKAFFGSIIGTLNHIVVGDTGWLKRFATHPAGYPALDPVRLLPAPASLEEILFADFGALRAHRIMLDEVIKRWAAAVRDEHLGHVLHYRNFKGIAGQKRFGSLVMHFFNHQTHHRGQATALLCQAGEDVGVTDLLALIPNEGAA